MKHIKKYSQGLIKKRKEGEKTNITDKEDRFNMTDAGTSEVYSERKTVPSNQRRF